MNVSLSTDGGTTWSSVAHSVSIGSFSNPAQNGVRPWFRLSARGGAPLDVTPRALGLASVSNLRDVGGYRTRSGQWVRMGVMYRSNALATSESPSDRAVVASLGLGQVYDLRQPFEIKNVPDVVPEGVQYQNLKVADSFTFPEAPTTPTEARMYMEDLERQMVNSASGKASFAALLNGLATSEGAQLWHCTAGKDRTGWGAAVVLTLLGVDPDTVMKDYLLSNDYYYNSPEVQALLASFPATEREVTAQIHLVHPSYLQAGLDEVKAKYGTMENYVIDGLGISPNTVKALKQRMLTKGVN
ncbi:tyrosine-protein phosphatase [Arthrobacter sp. OV608]|uniref:tyrosine-protein phosphatase n=1 Tax=Arthrobacter sp. OV608 TaxID=1882768 RepID=UPI0008C13411|nr:tyrosine-protein phosphatase [Arthrobacter sp. OV608]SER37284.1 protein-tyrosine phosphatase [Arthrobacter sp. OV608]